MQSIVTLSFRPKELLDKRACQSTGHVCSCLHRQFLDLYHANKPRVVFRNAFHEITEQRIDMVFSFILPLNLPMMMGWIDATQKSSVLLPFLLEELNLLKIQCEFLFL